MLFSELKCKDVINVKNCKKLGRVCDLEFDQCSGCICKIMVLLSSAGLESITLVFSWLQKGHFILPFLLFSRKRGI